jgi:hypothetical protein
VSCLSLGKIKAILERWEKKGSILNIINDNSKVFKRSSY